MYFDGGFGIEIGSASIPYTKGQYIKQIESAGARPVADIDVDVRVQWLGNATMNITVAIHNNEPDEYKGTVRAFVAELVSSLGWKDTAGNLYTSPFLALAINEKLTIPAGGLWEKTTSWNGNLFDDGYGNNFGGIEYDNIKVFAAVYDDTPHLKYSDPPNGSPFDAYYVDEAAGAKPDTLTSDKQTISSAGGKVELSLYAGGEHKNSSYFMLGSVSGTEPGTSLPLVTVPLNWDIFTNIVLSLANTPVFVRFNDALDASGTGSATLDTLGPLPHSAVGTVLYFAYVLYYPIDFASNPVAIEIVP